MIEIPFTPGPSKQRVTVTLNGRALSFGARWNTVTSAWYFDARDENGQGIIKGVRLTAGALPLSTPLATWGRFMREADGRQGMLAGLASASDIWADPGRSDLGDTYRVVYLAADEVEAIRGSQ